MLAIALCVLYPFAAVFPLSHRQQQIYTPQGSGIWYGRVSPHEVESIVTNTLEEGMILPALLRGGVNISRPGCKSLNDW
jgi:(2Fe-2S) ferredoxin